MHHQWLLCLIFPTVDLTLGFSNSDVSPEWTLQREKSPCAKHLGIAQPAVATKHFEPHLSPGCHPINLGSVLGKHSPEASEFQRQSE